MFDETEAWHLSDIDDGTDVDEYFFECPEIGYRSRKLKLDNGIEAPKARNEKAKIGEECRCPMCGKKFIKKSYQQKFCKIKCRNNYHNKRQYYY